MTPHGSDRVRVLGERVVLYCRASKGWTARTPATNVHSAHSGTTVLWDEQYFEVVEADAAGGGVRYVLLPWPDEQVFRVFDQYDADSEARRLEDYQATLKQRKGSAIVPLFGVILGHLPGPVQNRLANEYGLSATRMTLISLVPSVVFLGVCVWIYVGARLEMRHSPVPGWVWLFALLMIADSAVRFMVVMLQNRPNGSLPGTILYFTFNPRPPVERGRGLFMLEPDESIALQDAIALRAPLFTFLTPAEQLRLADRYGFEYRKHATVPAVVILVCALLGTVSSWVKVADSGSVSALLSLIVAGGLTIEQAFRLVALKRGPAGSVLGAVVRPFVRGYLR